jgi:hypothetical protein
MKLGYQCENNNNHKECGGRWIENPNTDEVKTVFCECGCHKAVTESEFLMATGKIAPWYVGLGH